MTQVFNLRILLIKVNFVKDYFSWKARVISINENLHSIFNQFNFHFDK